jgi:hypothetical protein
MVFRVTQARSQTGPQVGLGEKHGKWGRSTENGGNEKGKKYTHLCGERHRPETHVWGLG